MSEKRIEEIRERIAELKASLPAHSTPPSMMLEIEALEEELEALLAAREKNGGSH